MTSLKNDRLIKALLRQAVDVTPIWIMRQAGRYLPEYQQVRKQAGDFVTLCQTPELACQVTLQPLQRFDLDAAIIFSDILTIPDAMGLGLTVEEGRGPLFEHTIRSMADVKKLSPPDPSEQLTYVMQAIRLVQHELNGKVPLIGFSGSPWTLASYMVEGGGSRDFSIIKKMLYQDEETLAALLQLLVTAVIDYLTAQIEAGVQVVMLFDTWGGVLTPAAYQRFSLTPMQQIINALPKKVNGQTIPIILFSKGCAHSLEIMAESGCHALGLDWTIDLAEAKRRVAGKVALQGNLDPMALYADKQTLEQQVQSVLKSYGEGNGHVFNLGHGIRPDVPVEHVATLVEAVHRYSKK